MRSANAWLSLPVLMVLAGCGRSSGTEFFEGADAGVETDAKPVTRDAGAGCDCLSGTYQVTRKVCLNADCSSSAPSTDTFELAACNGTVVCHIAGVVHSCMSEADRVFRVYVDTLGYREYIFSTRSCDAPWTGEFAEEYGDAYAITATLVP